MAVVLANLYLVWLDRSLEAALGDGLLWLYRYIDDLCLVVRDDIPDECLVSNAESFHDNLKFTVSEPAVSGATIFLDLELTVAEGHLQFDLHRKPMNLYLYVPADSGHHRSVKASLIKGECTRLARRCMSEKSFLKHCKQVFQTAPVGERL